jgi:hypothetical protein
MSVRVVAKLAVLTALAGCSSVKVSPSVSDAEAKPADCKVDFLESAPARQYTEIQELKALVTAVPPQGPLEILRRQACEVGADAVIVTRNFVTNAFGHVLVAGIAIKYSPPPPPPPLPQGGTLSL